METSPKVGDKVLVVSYRDDWARMFQGEVAELDPFRVKVPVDDPAAIVDRTKTMLLTTGDAAPMKAQTEVALSDQDGDFLFLKFDDVVWNRVDRQRHQRFDVRLPIELTTVMEDRSEAAIQIVQGTTRDISLGGAWVEMDRPLPKESLIEFRCWPSSGQLIRALAIVVHCDTERGGVGVEFVNFIGPSQVVLEAYLDQIAA